MKARLLKDAGNRMQEIYETFAVKKKDGTLGKRRAVKKNRSGNAMTISLGTALHRTGELKIKPLAPACRENLLLLVEVRDNAIHFVNDDRDLALQVHEVGTASLVNYVATLSEWFDRDLGSSRFSILPLLSSQSARLRR